MQPLPKGGMLDLARFLEICVDTITSKLRRRGYEDKFMCSYNDLSVRSKQERNEQDCEMIQSEVIDNGDLKRM